MLCIFTVCQCYRLSCVWNLQGLFWTINIQPWMKSRQLIKVVYKVILWNSFTVTIKLGKMSRNMKFPTHCCMCQETSKGSDQPAHMRSLIRAFASHLNILWVLLKLLTEHHDLIGVSKLKRRLHRLVWVYTRLNATLLEITCHGSYFDEAGRCLMMGVVMWSLISSHVISHRTEQNISLLT